MTGNPLVPTFSPSSGLGLWESPWSIHWVADFGKCNLPSEIASPGSFFIIVNEEINLLHGMVKKSRIAPKQELDLARKRQSLCRKSTQ